MAFTFYLNPTHHTVLRKTKLTSETTPLYFFFHCHWKQFFDVKKTFNNFLVAPRSTICNVWEFLVFVRTIMSRMAEGLKIWEGINFVGISCPPPGWDRVKWSIKISREGKGFPCPDPLPSPCSNGLTDWQIMKNYRFRRILKDANM